MPLRDVIENQEVISCSPDTSIQEVARQMKNENVGAVLVCENNKPVGIVTDRDIVVRCIAESKDMMSFSARDIMTEGVESVTLEDGIKDVIDCMHDREVRRVLVVDDSGSPVSLLSFGDIYGMLAQEINDLTSVASTEKLKAAA